jgi:hypothetical protein
MSNPTSFSQILEQINSLIETLKGNAIEPKLSAIEVDILLSKLQILYEDLIKARSLNTNPVKPIVSDESQKPSSEQVAATSAKTIEKTTKPTKKTEVSPVEEVPTPKVRETKPEPEVIAKQKSATKEPAKIVAEKFEGKAHSLHEIKLQQEASDLASKLQHKPLHHIGEGIGLNDKFLFIRELFNNDNTLYQNTIQALNEAANLKAALAHIEQNFQWDMDSPIVQRFLHLVHRKHK